MSVCNLNYLFQPESVADHGASGRPQSVVATVMRNLFSGEREALAQFGGSRAQDDLIKQWANLPTYLTALAQHRGAMT